MKKGRLLLLASSIALLASCSFTGESSSYSRPPRSSSLSSEESLGSVESSSEKSSLPSSSSSTSSVSAKRQKAIEKLNLIKEYQEDPFFDPELSNYEGSGIARVSGVDATLTFDYDSSKEFFHVKVEVSSALSYDNWIYKYSSGRSTYIYNVSSLTKKYTRTAYAKGVWAEQLNDSITYNATQNIVKSTYSYENGLDMVEALGSTWKEEDIVSESYSYGSDGTMSGTIKVSGENGTLTESFAYEDYLGIKVQRKGTVSGSSINVSNELGIGDANTYDTPNLRDYTESKD